MSEHRVATRYAKALFQLAEEQLATDAVQHDLEKLEALIRANADLAAFLAHAGLSPAEQHSALETIFRGRVHDLVWRLLAFVVERRRLPHLHAICAAFAERYREARNILQANLTTAFELRPDQIAALRDRLAAKYQKQIELTVDTNASLLGGFVVRVRDVVHDFSVQGRLGALHAELAQA